MENTTESKQPTPDVPLAKTHFGMRVNLHGTLNYTIAYLKDTHSDGHANGLAYTLNEFFENLQETASHFYNNDLTACDELFQLYCIKQDQRKKLQEAHTKNNRTQPQKSTTPTIHEHNPS
jgi:hypothetical protein